MHQRVPRNWVIPGRHGRKPRLLVESADPALAISDFSKFTDAGFIVAHCEGPDTVWDCPLLRGGECPLVERADVILHQLDADTGVLEAIASQHPDTPVVAMGDHNPMDSVGTPGTVEVLNEWAPVESQIRSLYGALLLGEVLSRRSAVTDQPDLT
jgi:hypothetical protein